MSDTRSVHVSNTAEDYSAALRVLQSGQLSAWRAWLWLLPGLAIMLMLLFGAPAVLEKVFQLSQPIGLLLTAPFAFWVYLLSSRFVSRFRMKSLLDPRGPFLSPTDIELAPDGIRWKSHRGEGRTAWHAVNRIVETRSHIYLFIDRAAAHVVPKRCFSSEAAALEFAQEARRLTHANSTR